MKETDCILFIDETMAKFIIAYKNCHEDELKDVLQIDKGRINALKTTAKKLGILKIDGSISETAERCVDAIIKKYVDSIK